MHTISSLTWLPRGAPSGAGRKPQARVSTNERRAVCSEARMSSTPEFVGFKDLQVSDEAPSQDGESPNDCKNPLALAVRKLSDRLVTHQLSPAPRGVQPQMSLHPASHEP